MSMRGLGISVKGRLRVKGRILWEGAGVVSLLFDIILQHPLLADQL